MKKILYGLIISLIAFSVGWIAFANTDFAYAGSPSVKSTYSETISTYDVEEDLGGLLEISSIIEDDGGNEYTWSLVDGVTEPVTEIACSTQSMMVEGTTFYYQSVTDVSDITVVSSQDPVVDPFLEIEESPGNRIIYNDTSLVFNVDKDFVGSIVLYIRIVFTDELNTYTTYSTVTYVYDDSVPPEPPRDYESPVLAFQQSTYTSEIITSTPTISGNTIHLSRAKAKAMVSNDTFYDFVLSYVNIDLKDYAGEFMYLGESNTPTAITTPYDLDAFVSTAELQFEGSIVWVSISTDIQYLLKNTDGYVMDDVDEDNIPETYRSAAIGETQLKIYVDSDYTQLNVRQTDADGNITSRVAPITLADVPYGGQTSMYFVLENEHNQIIELDTDKITCSYTSGSGHKYLTKNGSVYTLRIVPSYTANADVIVVGISANTGYLYNGESIIANINVQLRCVYSGNPTLTVNEQTRAFDKTVLAATITEWKESVFVSASDAVDGSIEESSAVFTVTANAQTIAYSEWISQYNGGIGNYVLNIIVTNSVGNSTSKSVAFSINNNKPVTTAMTMNNQYEYEAAATSSFSATDSDGDILTYHVTATPSNIVNIQQEVAGGTCNVTITNKPNQYGSVTITYWVDDGIEESTRRDLSIRFLEYVDTVPPVLTLNNTSYVARKNTPVNLISFVQSVSDNNPAVTLTTADVQYGFVSTTANTDARIIDGNLIIYKSGEYRIKYWVSDGKYNSQEKVLVVSATNTVPTASNINVSKSYAEPIRVTLSGADADNEDFIYKLAPAKIYTLGDVEIPATVIIDPQTDALVVTPSQVYIGVGKVQYYVQDIEGDTSTTATVTISIVDDVSPVVICNTALPTTFLTEREYSSFDLTAYFTGVDAIDGAITPVITGTVDLNTVGEYVVTYLFKDSKGNAVPITDTTITFVVKKGDKPVITLIAPSTSIVKGQEFNIYDFIYSISDTEDGTISQGFGTNNKIAISGDTVDVNKPGTYKIYVAYEDSDGNLASTQEFVLTIKKPVNVLLIVLLSVGGVLLIAGAYITYRIIRFKRISKI